MRPNAVKSMAAAMLFLVLAVTSGCICNPVCPGGPGASPRPAVVHVHVYDYLTYAPVSWAVVELYEQSWWNWNYRGSWHVNGAGYTAAIGGNLFYDDCGGPEERHLGVDVSAAGYYPEWYEVELDYWDPTVTLSFYVVPWADCSDCGRPVEGERPDIPERELPEGRVKVGEPEAVD